MIPTHADPSTLLSSHFAPQHLAPSLPLLLPYFSLSCIPLQGLVGVVTPVLRASSSPPISCNSTSVCLRSCCISFAISFLNLRAYWSHYLRSSLALLPFLSSPLLLLSQELQTFIDTANAPIFGIDAHGRVNEWNNKVPRKRVVERDMEGVGLETVTHHTLRHRQKKYNCPAKGR